MDWIDNILFYLLIIFTYIYFINYKITSKILQKKLITSDPSSFIYIKLNLALYLIWKYKELAK